MLTFCVTTLWVKPARIVLPHSSQEIAYEQFRAGLSDPVHVQFLRFLAGAIRLDFGISLWQRKPAIELVRERLGATARLAATACGFAMLLGLPCGALAARKPGAAFDRFCTFLSLLGLAIADFWLGLMVILLFSLILYWFPTAGRDAYTIVLPALTLAVRPAGQIALATRTAVLDAMRQPYITTARAKGLGERRVLFWHALHNVFFPLVMLCGYEGGRIFSGYALVVETIFVWPGLGQLTLQAMNNDDLPVMQAILFVVAALVVLLHVMLGIGPIVLRHATGRVPQRGYLS